MRHRRAGRRLGRNAPHRLALYRNLALALFRHERIITTLPKAKAVRPFVEKLLTLAKQNTLHARRLVLSRLGMPSLAEVKPDEGKKGEEPDSRTILRKLFDELGPRFAERPGGYTRIIKRPQRRLGDAGVTAFLELLKPGETKVKKQATAPAPRVTAPTPVSEPTPPPAPEAPKAEEQKPAEQAPAEQTPETPPAQS
jgi:large subunit ribosomal protein L17